MALAVPSARVAVVHHVAAIVGAVDHLAVAILDIVDHRRLHLAPVVGQHGIGVGQLHHRRVARAKRDRQIILDNCRPPASAALAMTLSMPVCDAARTVIRLRDCSTPQRIVLGPHNGVEVAEAFVAKPGALPHAEWRIDDDRGRGHAILERGDIDDRLEGRSRLALRLGGAVVGRADDVEPALHRQHPPGAHFLRHEAAADFGDRSQRIAVAARSA